MSRKNSDPNNGANPMLYDPLQEGIGETSKVRQFFAATVGKKNATLFVMQETDWHLESLQGPLTTNLDIFWLQWPWLP